MDKVEIGERIRKLRKAAHLTQETLCARAGFSKKVIQELEAGAGNPTLESLISIAGAIGVPLLALFSDNEPSISEKKALAIIDLSALLPALKEHQISDLLLLATKLAASNKPASGSKAN